MRLLSTLHLTRLAVAQKHILKRQLGSKICNHLKSVIHFWSVVITSTKAHVAEILRLGECRTSETSIKRLKMKNVIFELSETH